MNRLLGGGLLAASLLATSATFADFDAIIKDCNGCHGDDGISQWDDMPTIAGIDPFVHSEALYAYLDEARPCAESEYRQGDTDKPATTMCEVVKDFDDGLIEEIAAYYAELPFVPAKQPFDPALAEAGKVVHDDACEKCHSEGGSLPEDEAGILAGQWMGYMRRTFEEYAAEERDQPKKMKQKMDPLTAEDVEALLHYYASQQ